ncbi:small G protein signaling modulator 1 isoform X2 [Carassius carassius]|uniref:small G protein signaling modulator 1 isoform X2 n=1 Tax=Carassius carassius TaxID=217509 RepID=UPI002868FB61|nr:small G protein signaling modulator 1 isoform X2 [Carassius carassius]
MAESETRQRLLRNVKKEVKQIMEEAVTRKFVHEDSSRIFSFCGVVEACVLHGLKRRAAGFLRSNKLAALFMKMGKMFPPAEELCRKVQELEQIIENKQNQGQMSQESVRKHSRSLNLSPLAIKHLWIRTALTEKLLDKILLYLVENSSKFYEREALLRDPVDGPILASLLVGPCALEYTKAKTANHFWTDPSADELVQRHRIHSGHCRQDSPTKRPALIQKRQSSGSMDDRPSLWARDYVESLHQNSRATLLFGKNNVLVQPTDDMEAIPGYLSLHQTADLMTLKWTPNQLMNGNMGEPDYEKSVYWDYAMAIRLEEIVYLHCHQHVDSGGTVVLVSQDGIQRPPFRFPKGGHLLQFLTCLETGLLPHGQLDPPLWSQRGKGKVFPKLRKRSPHESSESFSDKDEDEATDYVFRIIYPGSQEFVGPELMDQTVNMWQPTPRQSSCPSCSQNGSSDGGLPNGCNHDRAPLKLLCETMKHQIISRAFYGWLAYCRHLSTVRTHLSALVNPTIIEPDIPYDARDGLSTEVWKSFLQDSTAFEEEELLRLVYYGGVDPSLRKEVWPFLLGHYHFSMSLTERKEVDEQVRACYEQTMSEWLGCEAIVRQREKEQHAAALAKCASGASGDHGSRQDSTISTDSSQSSSSEKQSHAGSHSDSNSSTQVFGSVDEVDPIESEPKPKDEKPQPKIPNGTLPNCTSSPDSGHPSSRNFSVTSALSDCSPSTEETSTQESGSKTAGQKPPSGDQTKEERAENSSTTQDTVKEYAEVSQTESVIKAAIKPLENGKPQTLNSEDDKPQTLNSEEEKPKTLDSQTLNSEEDKLRTLNSEEEKSQTLDSQTLNSEEEKRQTLDSEEEKPQTLDSQTLNSKEDKLQTLNSEEEKHQILNSEEENPQTLDSQTLNSEEDKLRTLNSEEEKPQTLDSQTLNSEEDKLRTLNSEEEKPQTLDSQTLNSEENKLRTLNSEEEKPQTLDSQTLNSEDDKPQTLNSEEEKPKTLDSQTLNSEENKLRTLNSEEEKPQTLDSQTLNSEEDKLRTLNSEEENPQTLDSQTLNSEEDKLRTLNSEEEKPQTLDSQTLNSEEDKLRTLNSKEDKLQTLNSQTLNSEEDKLQTLNSEETSKTVTQEVADSEDDANSKNTADVSQRDTKMQNNAGKSEENDMNESQQDPVEETTKSSKEVEIEDPGHASSPSGEENTKSKADPESYLKMDEGQDAKSDPQPSLDVTKISQTDENKLECSSEAQNVIQTLNEAISAPQTIGWDAGRSIIKQITEPEPSLSKQSPDMSDDSPSALEMEDIASSVVYMSSESSVSRTPLTLARPMAPEKIVVGMPALELCMEPSINTSPEGTDSALSEEEPEMDNSFPKPDSLAVTGDKNDIVSPVSSIGTTYSQEQVDLYTLNLHRIDKDVQRCDRNYWYFTPDNLEKLRNIMCSYVWQHLDIGYVQGMCDLLAPLLVILDDEAMAFSCFTELMKRMNQNFPHGGAMDTHFANMRSLIQILDAELFELMQQNGDYTHFYFCYRWFLLDFKREMVYDDVFSVWETIWAARYTSSEHFVLFIALALVELYRNIILENNMDFTDIIKFFNEMAEHHDVPKLLLMARELVHKVQILIENK